MADLTRLADAYYIGGTKCGALMGEAFVTTHQSEFARRGQPNQKKSKN